MLRGDYSTCDNMILSEIFSISAEFIFWIVFIFKTSYTHSFVLNLRKFFKYFSFGPNFDVCKLSAS